MKSNVKKLIVVMCWFDKNGKIIVDDRKSKTPYGYHHILKVYNDDSFWAEATIDCKIPKEK